MLCRNSPTRFLIILLLGISSIWLIQNMFSSQAKGLKRGMTSYFIWYFYFQQFTNVRGKCWNFEITPNGNVSVTCYHHYIIVKCCDLLLPVKDSGNWHCQLLMLKVWSVSTRASDKQAACSMQSVGKLDACRQRNTISLLCRWSLFH